MSIEDLEEVRRKLALPITLVRMLETDRWVHPGHAVMQQKVPFIQDPLVFLGTRDQMLFESGPLMGPREIENETFSEYRGSAVSERDLPWIDVEKTLFVICNKRPGDDVGIALDFRAGNSPRVVGSDWGSGSRCFYREISPSFDAFIALLGM